MKVLFLTMGNEQVASSRVRVYQHLRFLQKEGIRGRVISYVSERQFEKIVNLLHRSLADKISGKLYNWIKVSEFLLLAWGYDLLFIQRVLLHPALLWLLNRKPIVFDMDDAIFLADRLSGAGGRHQTKFLRRLEYVLRISKAVIVSNDYLEQFARQYNDKVIQIISPVNTERYVPRADLTPIDQVVLGWIGSPWNIRYLQPLYPVFRTLHERYPHLAIHLVGATDLHLDGVPLTIKPWSLDREVHDLQKFDIGIMPLSDDPWSRGKGGYKLLQYMAVGIPCVASPVGINRELIVEGLNGFLAQGEEEWIKKLGQLIKDRDLRARMGRMGHQLAKQHYSYDVNSPKLVEVLKQTVTAN